MAREPRYNLNGHDRSYALISPASDVDTAAIFVHGFGGKPTGTWRDFHGLADEYSDRYPWWKTFDMFFYAYDSVHTPIRANAQFLGNFVDDVWNGRWWGDNPDQNRKYKDLLLVGHSEGGVIIRQLILDRYEAIKLTVAQNNPDADSTALKAALKSAIGSDFVLSSHIRLFAPACLGTNFSSWIGFLTSFSTFVAGITATSLVRNELLPTSSVLQGLKSGTEAAHAESPQIRSLFIEPLFGIPDQVVVSNSYRGEQILWNKGHDHFTVCKPSYLNVRPLEFVGK